MLHLCSTMIYSCFVLSLVHVFSQRCWNLVGTGPRLTLVSCFPVVHHDVVWWWRCSPTSLRRILIEEEIGLIILWTHADDISSCYLPVWQAQLWAPSPWFWFLCSSFAVGGLASEGLSLPSLKSDVHSTCWFFKQLCPLKKEEGKKKKKKDKLLTLSLQRNWGRGKGVGGYGAWANRLCFSVSLFLSLSHYLSLSLLIYFFNSFIIRLTEPRHNDLSDFAWHVVEREPDQNDQKSSVASHLKDPSFLQPAPSRLCSSIQLRLC